MMRKTLKIAKEWLTTLGEIFDDWLTRSAGIVCAIIIVIVFYNMNSTLPDSHPVLGAMVYALVPVLFIAGGIIFVMAILKFSKSEKIENTKSETELDASMETQKGEIT